MKDNKKIIEEALELIYQKNMEDKGIEILYSLAKNNNPDAQYELGLLFSKKNQHKKSIDWYNKAVDNGNIKAAYSLGLMYFHGNGCNKDLDKCINLWTIAAKSGHLSAIHNLSTIYLFIDEKKDIEFGIKLCKFAIENGHIGAKANLGMYYKYINDYDNAIKYLLEPAESGNVSAQVSLGLILSDENYYKNNYKEAAKWFTAAALQDNSDAIHYLGVCFFNGYGVKKNILKARDLWVRSSLMGNQHSQGACYGMVGVNQLLTKGVAPVEYILKMYDECDENIEKE